MQTVEILPAADGKSGARLERLVDGSGRFVRKHQTWDTDWVMRISGDRGFRPLQLWRTGLLHRLPACLDHAVVGMTLDAGRLEILMRDVGADLVPEGDAPVPHTQHRRFLDHMAALHAGFWGFEDRIGLLPLDRRYDVFAPRTIAGELTRPPVPPVIPLVAEGWRRLPDVAPRLARLVIPLLEDSAPLVAALRRTPSTLLHGDWKMGNLGSTPDGRTILLDWALPGQGPACTDLAHYLALNAARLPEPKEAAIAAYRSALERHGVDTRGWFAQQLGLCVLGHMVLFGWEKALGGHAELAWWEARACAAARWLP
jgi:hypothetical protein